MAALIYSAPRRRRSFASSLLLCLFLALAATTGVSARKKDQGQCDCTTQCEAMEAALQSKLTESSSELKATKAALAETEARLESIKAESTSKASAAESAKAASDELLSQKDTAITALQSEIDALKKELESSKATADTQSSEVARAEEKCRLDLAESISKQNDAIQSERSLREQLARTESEADRREADVRKRVTELSKEAETSRSQVRQMNDRYAEARRELIETQAEARELHKKLTSRYVNTTLMYEDGVWLADRTAVMARDNANWLLDILADFWTALRDASVAAVVVMKPVAQDLAADLKERYVNARGAAQPHLRKLSNSTKAFVGPHIDTVKTATKKAYDENAKAFVDDTVLPYVMPVWERACEIVESIRLSAVSAIQQSSSAMIEFFSSNKDKPGDPLRKGALNHLKWMHDNAEYSVKVLSIVGGAILVYLLFGSFLWRWGKFLVKAVTSPVWYPIWLFYWLLSKAFGGGKKDATTEARSDGNGGNMNGH